MKTLKLWLVAVTTALAVVACQKEMSVDTTNGNDPKDSLITGNGCQLTRWIEGTRGLPDDTIYVFKYDAQGRINKILDSGYDYATCLLKYNSAGRLSEMFMVELFHPADTFSVATYAYTNSGLLKSVKYAFRESEDIFHYGTDTLPTGMTHHYYDDFYNKHDSVQYKFSWNNGNMIKAERFDNSSSEVLFEASYTNIPNQTKTLSLLELSNFIYFNTPYFSYFNKNMSKNIKYPSSVPGEEQVADYNYIPDTSGRVISYTESWQRGGTPSGVRTINMTYGCK